MIGQLIAEATECDFKVALEIKKPKSWLKGTHRSFDALITDAFQKDYSFTLLEATYLDRTGLRMEPSDYVSFGLANKDGLLTNAGKLLTDQHTVFNSRMFCTRWNGLEKGSIFDDALDDKEYEGNLIYLLQSGCEFIRNNSKVRFSKEALYRVDKPDYAERAVIEALVNSLIQHLCKALHKRCYAKLVVMQSQLRIPFKIKCAGVFYFA